MTSALRRATLARLFPPRDFTPARLVGLQQRVCELLAKNQQLRMALMAEKAESHCDQLTVSNLN